MGLATLTEFLPNTYLIGDRAGRGRWEIGHYREHVNFLLAFVQQTPSITIPDYPLLRIGESPNEQKFWKNAHQEIHEAIRGYLGIDGIDLSEVDLNKPDSLYSWFTDHNAEHALILQALGLS